MAKLADHPTVRRYQSTLQQDPPAVLDAAWLRQVAMEAGADDVGFVSIDRPELDDQRADILANSPWTKGLIAIVVKMNREPIRNPARSVANLEFHDTGELVNHVGHEIVRAIEEKGIRAVNPAMGFPMETANYPGKLWVVSHKPVAVAAGLGKMGIHRNVIHPKFGNFILLGTVLVGAEISEEGSPLDYNPCLECKLCVAACPVGAIGADGHFDTSACFHHNYREFMGGFGDWVENVVESKDAKDYRSRVSDQETVSMWQSLGFGPNYKAAYCLAVCPAGEDVIGPFLGNRKGFLEEVVNPLQDKKETLYVVPGTDAESYAAKRFPHKTTKRIGNALRMTTLAGFLRGMPIAFQRHQSEGLSATYHFTFTGAEAAKATVVIKDKTIRVDDGHTGTSDLRVIADSQTWVGFLRKERSLVWALLRRKIVLKGSPMLLVKFGRCFPS